RHARRGKGHGSEADGDCRKLRERGGCRGGRGGRRSPQVSVAPPPPSCGGRSRAHQPRPALALTPVLVFHCVEGRRTLPHVEFAAARVGRRASYGALTSFASVGCAKHSKPAYQK